MPTVSTNCDTNCVKSAMRAANQLPGGGPLIRMMPLHVNQKSDYDDDDDDDDDECSDVLIMCPANMPVWVPYGLPIWDPHGECNRVPHGSHMS